LEEVVKLLATSWDRGVLTNGPLVRRLEDACAQRLGVDHVVAVASCTSGLMLVMQALAPGQGVVVPSFTFSASAHALAWNGVRPVFAECDPLSFQLDVADATRRLDGAGGVLATHVFGAPCQADVLTEVGRSKGVPVVFDAAHAFGALRGGRPIGGFGTAEVFSLTPTKPLVAGEGGLVVTGDPGLAETVRIGRDYGNPGDYDTRFPGLNARMSEAHAATAMASLARFEERLDVRRALAGRYLSALAAVPGVVPQVIPPEDASTYKDLTIQVDAGAFGMGRDGMQRGLAAEGIDTRRYFDPPVHRQQSYAPPAAPLPVTDAVAGRVLTLPFYPSMQPDAIDRVVEVLLSLQSHAEELAAAPAVP
jgi:dTDP-4-amino-4,6-dideoxygalactose transaminase